MAGKREIAAYVAGGVMAGLGSALAAAALALSGDAMVLWAATRMDARVLGQLWAALHAIWGAVVGAVVTVAGSLVGGAEGAKAVSLWMSVGAASLVGWRAFGWGRRAFGLWVMHRNGD